MHCPSEYAYGSSGAGRIIPPDSDLIFELELIDINPIEQAEPEQSTRAKKKKKSRWADVPLTGDETTHICFQPALFFASFVLFMMSFGYCLYAVIMPVERLTKGKRR